MLCRKKKETHTRSHLSQLVTIQADFNPSELTQGMMTWWQCRPILLNLHREWWHGGSAGQSWTDTGNDDMVAVQANPAELTQGMTWWQCRPILNWHREWWYGGSAGQSFWADTPNDDLVAVQANPELTQGVMIWWQCRPILLNWHTKWWPGGSAGQRRANEGVENQRTFISCL